MRLSSEITQGIAPGVEDVSFYVHPKSDEKINDHRRAHGEKRDIDKIFPDGGSSDTHFFAHSAAHPKYMPFYKMFKPLHVVKIKKLWFGKFIIYWH